MHNIWAGDIKSTASLIECHELAHRGGVGDITAHIHR